MSNWYLDFSELSIIFLQAQRELRPPNSTSHQVKKSPCSALIYVDKHVRPGDFRGLGDGDVSLSVSTEPVEIMTGKKMESPISNQ